MSRAPKDKQTREALDDVFDNGKIGIIINERVINLPIEIAPHLHDNLYDELKEATKVRSVVLRINLVGRENYKVSILSHFDKSVL